MKRYQPKQSRLGQQADLRYLVIPTDIIREILFKADISVIKNYHRCRKNIKMDKAFWQTIYKRDKVEMFETSNHLLKQYNHTLQCQKEADQIITLAKLENDTIFISRPYQLGPSITLSMDNIDVIIWGDFLDIHHNQFNVTILGKLLYFNPDLCVTTGNTSLRLKHLSWDKKSKFKPHLGCTTKVERRIKFYDSYIKF